MSRKLSREENMEVIFEEAEDYDTRIPEHAIVRLAQFLLRRMQDELTHNED